MNFHTTSTKQFALFSSKFSEKYLKLQLNSSHSTLSTLSRFLLNVTINEKRVFNPDGTARKSDLKIVNLRRNASSAGITWEEVMK